MLPLSKHEESADVQVRMLLEKSDYALNNQGFYKNHTAPMNSVLGNVTTMLNDVKAKIELRMNEVGQQCKALNQDIPNVHLSATHVFALGVLSLRPFFTTQNIPTNAFKALTPENTVYQSLVDLFHEHFQDSKCTPVLQSFEEYYKGICLDIDFKQVDIPEPETYAHAYLLLGSAEGTQLLASLWADEDSPSAFVSLYALVKIFAHCMWYFEHPDVSNCPIKEIVTVHGLHDHSMYLKAFGVPRSLIVWTQDWPWVLCDVITHDGTRINKVEVPLYILVKVGFVNNVLHLLE